MAFDYSKKFQALTDRTMYGTLGTGDRQAVHELAFAHRLTFQEFRQIVESARDLTMWGEAGISEWLAVNPINGNGEQNKDRLLAELRAHMDLLKSRPKEYSRSRPLRPTGRERLPVVSKASDKTVFGMCPVASEKTVCCNLRTIDAVENCVFGCSYCAVQTFYQREITFDEELVSKLDAISLDPDRHYHIGTGQSSDSLAWGNKNGSLDALLGFAATHANVLLEFKTKSDNVQHLVDSDVPRNVVCSWSLNTPVIVDNEEHFTANLDQRLAAARRVADRDIGVAFHFHPMVYYSGWREDYTLVADRILNEFDSTEVSFISLGSVTLTKPVIKKIRELGNPTRILQMEFVADPHGKLTYPDEVKIEMFNVMLGALAPWREDVFMYLCMEKAQIWHQTFGHSYEDNESFERDFAHRTRRNSESPQT